MDKKLAAAGVLLVILAVSGVTALFLQKKPKVEVKKTTIPSYPIVSVESWDSFKSALVVNLPDGSKKSYAVNPLKTPVVLSDPQEKDEKLIMGKNSDEWRKLFCPKDKIEFELKDSSLPDKYSIENIVKFKNLGPRKC